MQLTNDKSRLRLLTALSVFLLCFVAARAFAGFFDGKTKFFTTKTEHFYIHYPNDLGPVAAEMSEIAERVHERMSRRLRWTPKRRTHVVITDRSETANGIASVLPDNYILLYAAIPTPDSSLDHYRNYYEYLLTHEYTHILHIDQVNRAGSVGRAVLGKIIAPNGATPGWMREGMAVYEESLLEEDFGRNHSDYTDMFLRASHYEGAFPQIDQIAGLTSHFPAGLGPYLYGGKFFQWLAENYGEDRMYEYQKEYASSLWLYSLNNKARRVYGKSFLKLWKEYRADMAARFDRERDELNAKGLTPMTDVVKMHDKKYENAVSFYTPHPNGQGFAYFESGLDEAPRIVVDARDGSKPHYLKRRAFGQMTFSKNGRYLAFAGLSAVQKKTSLSDVFYYDLKNRKLFRVTDAPTVRKSMRVMDPDFSPVDGGSRWLVMVRNFQGTDQLYVFDLFEKRGYVVTDEPKGTQLSHPRFSPDGKRIVASRKDPESGFRDIVVYSDTGKKIARLTRDAKSDMQPVFSRDGGKVYFTSSRTGVFNVFAYDFKQDSLSQVTNVLTGAFQPMPGADGEMFVQTFSTRGAFVQKFDPKASNPSLLRVADVLGVRKAKKKAQAQAAVPANGTGDNATGVSFIPQCPVARPLNASLMDESPAAESAMSPADGFCEPVADASAALYGEKYVFVEEAADGFATDVSSNENFTWEGGDAPAPAGADLPGDLPGYANFAEPDRTGTDNKPVLPIYTDTQEPKQPQPKRPSGNRSKRLRKSQEPQVEPAEPKTYPSAYKDALADFPREMPTDYAQPANVKKYSPLPHILRPSYIIPNVLLYESAAVASVVIGRYDPLYRHSWTAFVDYRTDAAFLGGGGTYVYSRYDPTFYVGGLRYVVDWGTVTTRVASSRFFEERWQAYAGAGYKTGLHGFNLMYFYEHRSPLTQLAGVNFVNMKPYAGFKFQYTVANYKKFPDSISQEDGYLAKAVVDVTDGVFMSDAANEEIVSTVDLRYYFEMPWSNHHVFAIRAAGGWQWGDVQQFGTFRLGGPLGEGAGAAKYSARIFPLRGLAGISYGGDRVFIFSAEYRWPLAENVNAGIGTWPVFLDKLHLNLFVDGGDIKYRTELPDLFTRLMVAGGAELRGDFVLGYGLPITTRLGYGVIFTNRDRLGNLTDAITQASLRYGSAYFQVGTTF